MAGKPGDGRPACFLNGGTDSSTLGGMLPHLGPGRPAAYSIGFDAQGNDKAPALLKSVPIEPIVGLPGAGALRLTRKAGSYVAQARRPMPDRLQLYKLLMRVGPAEALSPRLLAQVDPAEPLQLQSQVWQQVGACGDLKRELAYEWRFSLAESDLPKVSAATSLAGVQLGYPMLDDGLLQFLLGLPTRYKLEGMQLRWIFKEALRAFPPDAIHREEEARLRTALRRMGQQPCPAAGPGTRRARQPGRTRRGTRRLREPADRAAPVRAPRVLWRVGVDPDDARAVPAGQATRLSRGMTRRCRRL
jgi:hypothetical protein